MLVSTGIAIVIVRDGASRSKKLAILNVAERRADDVGAERAALGSPVDAADHVVRSAAGVELRH